MSADKENNAKRSKSMRQSIGTSKQILFNSEVGNSTELNNEFAGYLDYVRTLQGENENLKAEKDNLIESCDQKISMIQSTYGSEIDALRKALDESTQEKCTIEYHNDKLLEENNNLKIKFARKLDLINELEKKYEEAEASLIKNRRCVDQYEVICQDVEELGRSNCLLREQLKTEVSKRTESESRVLTLTDEVEFQRKLHANNNSVIRDSSMGTNNKSEAYYSEKFDIEMKSIREELTDEFDQYKEQMEEAFTQKLEELSTMNSKLNDKCNKIYNEKKLLQTENVSIHAEMAELDSKIASLSAREAKQTELIAKVNEDHEEFIREILEENSDLKEKVQEMTTEVTALVNEKIANEKETYIFRSMLKGEQSRFNLSDIASPKKRKFLSGDNGDSEITAWSKDSMKIFCDSNYNGNYIVLSNEGSENINLNEWKIEIRTSCGIDVLYTFPERILDAGSCLKAWSDDQDVEEDNINVIMNVALPSVDTMSCLLKNDMDETEANFDLKRCIPKRRILKATVKKTETPEKCSIM